MAAPQASLDALASRIDQRQARVGVIGLGYVGLPLALAFAEHGFPVLGFDIDRLKIEALDAGRCYIRHLDGGRLEAVRRAGRFDATDDFGRLADMDAILICVPTPLDAHQEPDLSFVDQTAEQIARRLRPAGEDGAQLVILESTTYPGTTEERLRPRLEASGRVAGEDFFLAFSPEREDPGNPDFGTTDIPKVVGGFDAASTALAERLYSAVFKRVVPVSSPRAAEATKLTENIFRAVNIALVNELKTVYEGMGIDVWEVLDAAATKPFGFMRFTPGPGWGGHCIPVDPFYLAWKARAHGLKARFIELAGEVNREMPAYVIERLQRALNDRGLAVKGAQVLILGLAYKANIDDPRESPAFALIDRLLALGAEVSYHDPHVPEAPAMRTWPDLPPMRSAELMPELLEGFDAVVIATDHEAVDYALVSRHARLIIDTRGIYRTPRANVVRA